LKGLPKSSSARTREKQKLRA